MFLYCVGAEAVQLLGCTVGEAEEDPARLAAWYSQHTHVVGDFGVRVLTRGQGRECHVIRTWAPDQGSFLDLSQHPRPSSM